MLKFPSVIEKPSKRTIFLNQIIRYIRIGSFLHIMGLVGIALFFVCFEVSRFYFTQQQPISGYIWSFLSLCFVTVPVFSEFDAYGRYQNYKQIKDAIFEMGYDPRLIKPFMYSKCQRDAVIVAARDLDHHTEVKAFFYAEGYRKYHILPDAFNKNPLVLFNKLFWKRILFTEYYPSRNFYW